MSDTTNASDKFIAVRLELESRITIARFFTVTLFKVILCLLRLKKENPCSSNSLKSFELCLFRSESINKFIAL